MNDAVEISFGMIVLNGEPFMRYNLEALYPHAHQIIVVEGACPSAAAVASPEGHSLDGTLETLRNFKERDDPEGKVIIVTAEDEGKGNGFWHEKDEMSKAYAKRATGNYLWQIDSDEFYHEGQIVRLIEILKADRPDAVSFPMLTFWGSIKYLTDSFYLIRDNAREYHRLFAWNAGYSYATHFPPTVCDERGVDLRSKKWIRAKWLEKQGIFLYHYSLLFPHQVYNKVSYYKARINNRIDTWEDRVYRRLENPYNTHNVYRHIGWLERFSGSHPSVIHEMMGAIERGHIKVDVRDCADVERLLSKRFYVISCRVLKKLATMLSYQPFYFFSRVYFGLENRLAKYIGKFTGKAK